eukprot:6925138-Alexandrium_andersonii.AAC.1
MASTRQVSSPSCWAGVKIDWRLQTLSAQSVAGGPASAPQLVAEVEALFSQSARHCSLVGWPRCQSQRWRAAA